MRLESIKAILLVALLSFLLFGCGGGGGGGGSSVTVSASVGSGYTVIPIPNWLDKVYAFFAGEPVYALGTGVVNQVVAVPSWEGHFGGDMMSNTVIADIASDGSFSLTLDRSYEWVLLLINSEAASLEEKVVSYVAAKVTEEDTLIAYSGKSLTSNLDLGTLVNNGEEAEGVNNSASFNLTLEELTAVAQADNGYKHMINAYLNYDPATGRNYAIAPIFGFQAGNISDFTGEPTTPQITGGGLSFFLETGDLESPEKIMDICLGLGDFGLYPPGIIADAAGKVYDSENGIVNDAIGDSNMGLDGSPWTDGCYDGDMGVTFPDGGSQRHVFMGIKTASDQLQVPETGMPEGHWKLKSGETTIAEFDLAVGSPYDAAGNLTIPVPAIQVISETNGRITAINTSWFVYSPRAGGYLKLSGSNALALDTLVSGSVVTVQDEDGPNPSSEAYNVFLRDPNDYGGPNGPNPYPYQSNGLWTTAIDFSAETIPWYLPGSEGASVVGHLSPTFIRVDVAMGGIDYQFGFNGPDYVPQ
jgi:hypothetical protein